MKKYLIIILVVASAFLDIYGCQKTDKAGFDKKISLLLGQIVNEMDLQVNGGIEASRTAAAKAEDVFRLKKGYGTARVDKDIYYKDGLGILSEHGHKTKSNVYVGRDIHLDNYAKWYIQASEELIPIWEENIKQYPYLGWQYLIDTKYTINRFYPWSETTMSMGTNVKWREFGFYQSVIPENDPQRNLNWGRIGSDILGLGLLSSISIPIYVDNEFVAISSIDFLITQTFKNYLYKDYPGQNSYFMLIDRKTSQVILRNEKNYGDRGWDIMFNYNYLDKLVDEQPERLSLLKTLTSSQEGQIEVMVPYKKSIYYKQLASADWVAVIVTE